MYQKDSNTASLLWGRTGAAVLLVASVVLGSFGYTFGEEEQAAAFEAVSSVLASVALVQVVISKIRETKKVKQNQEEVKEEK